MFDLNSLPWSSFLIPLPESFTLTTTKSPSVLVDTVAELDCVGNQVTDDSFYHIDVCRSHQFFIQTFKHDGYAFLGSHWNKYLGSAVDYAVDVDLLSVNVLFVQAILCPLQEVVEKLEYLFRCLVHHLKHFVYLIANLILIDHHQDGVIHHLQRTKRRA